MEVDRPSKIVENMGAIRSIISSHKKASASSLLGHSVAKGKCEAVLARSPRCCWQEDHGQHILLPHCSLEF